MSGSVQEKQKILLLKQSIDISISFLLTGINCGVNMKTPRKIMRNRYVFVSLFAALVAVSGFLIIPLPVGIPIVLKNMFVVLCGTVLGSFYGCISILIFTVSGLIGIPVFVIPGGPGVFLTPLGGYIFGYFISSLCSGLVCGLPRLSEKKVNAVLVLKLCIASFSGFALILFSGAVYMMFFNQLSFKAALTAGVLPFVFYDSIKLIISVPLALKLRPVAARYINPGE
jgi:biotin transport system substrate-specific component